MRGIVPIRGRLLIAATAWLAVTGAPAAAAPANPEPGTPESGKPKSTETETSKSKAKAKPAAKRAVRAAPRPPQPADAWPRTPGFIPPSTEPGGEYESGRSLAASGMHREAMLMASSLTVLDPSHAGAWHLLGNCRWAAGERVAAQEAWARAVKIEPDGALSKYMKAKRRLAPPPAPQGYRTAIVESLAARALLEAGQAEAAARRAEAATLLDPLSAADWDLLGDCRQAARDSAGARAAWSRALTLAPKDKGIKAKLKSP